MIPVIVPVAFIIRQFDLIPNSTAVVKHVEFSSAEMFARLPNQNCGVSVSHKSEEHETHGHKTTTKTTSEHEQKREEDDDEGISRNVLLL